MKAGQTDLTTMLATLQVRRRPGVFTFASVARLTPALVQAADAIVRESHAITVVLTVDTARALGVPVGVEMAWLSLTVHSSLEAVGLTAVLATRLARHDIACNVLAGHHHDHLLVPAARAEDAMSALIQGQAEG